MDKVTAALQFGDQGPQVANLHLALEALGAAVRDPDEVRQKVYKSSTTEAVGRFKAAQSLSDREPDKVGEEAAARMNDLLKRQGLLTEAPTFDVSGQVAQSDGTGESELAVRAFDHGLGRERLLGETRTDADGHYRIDYKADQLLAPQRASADLLVRVHARSGDALISSPLIIDALPHEVVNLVLGDEAFRGPDRWQELTARLAKPLAGISLTEIEPRDIYSLAHASELDFDEVSDFVRSQLRAEEWETFPEEVYFAWFRTGQPTTRGALLGQSATELEAGLQEAIDRNLVSRKFAQIVDTIEPRLAELRSRYLVIRSDQPVEAASLGQLLALTPLAENQRQGLLQSWQTFEGDLKTFWQTQKEQLGAEAFADLELTLQLGSLTRNHLPLIKVLKQQSGVHTLRDLSDFSETAWENLLEAQDLDIPTNITGEDPPAQRRAYAQALHRFTEQLMPTRMLAASLRDDSNIDSARFDRFFERHPGFEFRDQTVRQFLSAHPDALDDDADPDSLRRELEALQRVFHLSPVRHRAAAAKVLWQHKLHNAWAINLRGEQELLDLFEGDPETALIVSRQAQRIQQVSLGYYLSMMDANKGQLAVLPKPAPGDTPPGIPDLESLFGPQGYCDCQHCRSFFGPSAYFVDLLLFIQRTPSALENLLQRRPDLANIELDCENSQTPMPYIDLVVEVLENAVSPRDYQTQSISVLGRTVQLPFLQAGAPNVPQTESDPATLQAQPQHLLPSAYEQLSGTPTPVSYPWGLPFSLWTEEARVYLEHLGVPRWQLMETLLGEPSAVAPEYLGLIPAEAAFLTDAAPSLAQLAAHWGVADVSPWLGSAGAPASAMLEKSGLSYPELGQLLGLRYVQAGASEGTPFALVFKTVPSASGNALSCDIGDAAVMHLTAAGLDRIHRITRLQRKLGTDWIELDQTLIALGGAIDNDLLDNLAAIERIADKLPRPVKRDELLSWWSRLQTHGYPDKPSLFDRVFLNPVVDQPIQDEFSLNVDRDELQDSSRQLDLANPDLAPDLVAVLLGGLRAKLPGLKQVAISQWGSPVVPLNLANLSYLYRVFSFVRAVRLSVPEYLALVGMTGMQPLPGPGEVGMIRPQDTLAFLQLQASLLAMRLNPLELDELVRHQAPDSTNPGLAQPEIERILFDLNRALGQLLELKADTEAPLHDRVAAKLAQVLAPEDVEDALGLLDQDVASQPADPNLFIAENLVFFTDTADAQAQLVNGGLTETTDRYQYTLIALNVYLLETTLIQALADAFNLDAATIETLVGPGGLPNPGDAGQPAKRVFLSEDFLEMPQSEVLFSETDFPMQVAVLRNLDKLARLARLLALDSTAVRFLLAHGVDSGLPDLRALPLEPQAQADFTRWRALIESVQLDRARFRNEISLFELLEGAYPAGNQAPTPAALLNGLHVATGWDLNDLDYLAGTEGLVLNELAEFQQPDWLLTLAPIMRIAEHTGASVRQLADWARWEVTEQTARSVRHAAKAKHGDKRWLEVAPTLRDVLRERQRDALASYVLHHGTKNDGSGFEDLNDLYAYFLVDSQMSACADTSRIKLASSAVQLYVQRILLNLEPTTLTRDQADEWQWRKYYRVWEANRKVLMWPENWIEPELRDDKSPFFQELETELLQAELTQENIEQAYVGYLHKLHDVAHLEIAGVHYDQTTETLHIFGRTGANPPIYYYRRWEKRRDWTPWEKLELDIHNAQGIDEPQLGVLLLPFVHNRRLFLFWPLFTLRQDEPTNDEKLKIRLKENDVDQLKNEIQDKDSKKGRLEQEKSRIEEELAELKNTIENWDTGDALADLLNAQVHAIGLQAKLNSDINTISSLDQELPSLRIVLEIKEAELTTLKKGHQYYDLQLAFSEYRQGRWTAEKTSHGKLQTAYFEGNFSNGDDLLRYLFTPRITNNGALVIEWFLCGQPGKSGLLEGTLYKYPSQFIYDACRQTFMANGVGDPQATDSQLPFRMNYMKQWWPALRKTPLRLAINNSANDNITLLNAPHSHSLSFSLDTGVFHITTPFFFEDSSRTFLVIPPRLKLRLPGLKAVQQVSHLTTAALSNLQNSISEAAYQQSLKPKPETLAGKHRSFRLIPTDGAKTQRYYGAADANQAVVRSSPMAITTVARQAMHPANPSLGFGALGKPPGKLFSGSYRFRTFYHPYTCLFLRQLDRYGIDGLLDPSPARGEGRQLDRQLTPDHLEQFDFADYKPNLMQVKAGKSQPREDITFDHADAYAGYNWELFFHIPLMIANRLSQDQRFEAAQRWYHYIFNPTETEHPPVADTAGRARFWKIKPFYEYTSAQMQADMAGLLNGERQDQISAWEDDPFNPHLLARFRPLAYMKATIIKYLDNLVAWADMLFRRDTIETLNEAAQLYVLAGQILGKLPVRTGAQTSPPQTFNELAADLNDMGNAWVQIESAQNSSATIENSVQPSPAATVLIPYFCYLPNEKILGYWETVADRLYKLRNCLNIEGVRRQLRLFEPPIDPALLVRARASGMDISSALNDLFAPLPHYRFSVMIQQAQSICQDLKALGNALLAALEKNDGEALALTRAHQETVLLKANRQIRNQQIKEAEHARDALIEAAARAQLTFENYRDRKFLKAGEAAAIGLSMGANAAQIASSTIAGAAAGAKQAPTFYQKVHVQGMSSGTTVETKTGGGESAGGGLDSVAMAIQAISGALRAAAEATSTFAQYDRRQEDWDLQRDMAEKEIEQVHKQILAAEIRIDMAKEEQKKLELQIEQAETVADFLERKWTHKELYGWMAGQISGLYFQTYRLAYDLAKRAEKAYQFELGVQESNYIRFGYWDNLKKGLLAGEKLFLDLKRLEMAYQEQNRRDLELTKPISLRRLDPKALLMLRATGVCTFNIPEYIFDLDHPGHYFRRIKSVSISIPCVSGPFTTIGAQLSLEKNRVRISATAAQRADYEYLGVDDPNFRHDFVGQQFIATSSGQHDSGLFELNFRDERYLPFEGAGAISQWRLELPSELRQFDYDSISDVLLHMRYTARQGGATLAGAAIDYVKTKVLAVHDSQDGGTNQDSTPEPPQVFQLFHLPQEFPDEWHRAMASETKNLKLTIRKNHFTYLAQVGRLDVRELQVWQSHDREQLSRLMDVLVTPADVSDPAQFNDPLNEPGGALLELNLSTIPEGAIVFLIVPYILSNN